MREGLDLFGQVAGIPPDSPRLAHYVRGYDVAGKVARAKLDGTYHATVSRRQPSPWWWSRFRWH